MNKDYEKLVEWVARIIWGDEYERANPVVPTSWEQLPDWSVNVYTNLAKKILSHTNLAWIEEETCANCGGNGWTLNAFQHRQSCTTCNATGRIISKVTPLNKEGEDG